jgi:hypothetical protein
MANEIGKFDALTSLTPDADFGVKADGTISWKDYNTIPQPSDEEINNEVIRLQAEYDAQDYVRKREAEYPSIQDLVVALYDTEDKAAIDSKRAEIKLKYPKPVA